MLPRIDSIRQVRTKLGVTQKRLAAMTGVSASMINQIESGRSQPSYETAKRIFESLAALEGGTSPHRAGEVCSREIVALSPSDTLRSAIERMRRFSISQIPIFADGRPVGTVTEDRIVRYLADATETDLDASILEDMMDPAPPIVDYSTPANALVPLIRFTKCILVSKESKIVGIITASDALKMMG